MNPLELLLRLFKINIELPKVVKIIFSPTINYKTQTTNNSLTINSAKTNGEERVLLPKSILKSFDENGRILEEELETVIVEFGKTDRDRHNQELLNYFKGKISGVDLEILRASLFIKDQYQAGKNITTYKQDLMNRHGDRGKNISNICSADYFESLIKPLFEELINEDSFSPQKLAQVFDRIVMEYPFAIFVNQVTSSEKLLSDVKQKINRDRQAGIHKINIHGIGKQNVIKINNLLNEIKEIIEWPPEIEAGPKYIIVSIVF